MSFVGGVLLLPYFNPIAKIMTRLLKLFTALIVIFAGHTDGASRPPKKILLLFGKYMLNSYDSCGGDTHAWMIWMIS